MSFQAMTWAVKKELPSTQKLVLLMLANRSNNDTGRCDPCHKTLARECGLSQASVKRVINKLEKSGLVEIVRRSYKGVSMPNQYNLLLDGVGSQGADPGSQGTEGSGHSELGSGHSELQNQEFNQEFKPGNKPGESDDSHGGEAPPDPVRSVFDYWVYVMGKNPNRNKLTNDRRRKIQSRLREYSVDECCRAIDGCASSDFHMGRHPDTRGKKYNGIDLIFRNGEKLEGFRDMAEGAQRATEGANAPPEFPD